MATSSEWFVYIVECRDSTLYTGVARDPLRRLLEHNGSRRGARYTRARRPVILVYVEPAHGRSAALRRESSVRHLPRRQKISLIVSAFDEGLSQPAGVPSCKSAVARLRRELHKAGSN